MALIVKSAVIGDLGEVILTSDNAVGRLFQAYPGNILRQAQSGFLFELAQHVYGMDIDSSRKGIYRMGLIGLVLDARHNGIDPGRLSIAGDIFTFKQGGDDLEGEHIEGIGRVPLLETVIEQEQVQKGLFQDNRPVIFHFLGEQAGDIASQLQIEAFACVAVKDIGVFVVIGTEDGLSTGQDRFFPESFFQVIPFQQQTEIRIFMVVLRQGYFRAIYRLRQIEMLQFNLADCMAIEFSVA